jgi:hypothetical protein
MRTPIKSLCVMCTTAVGALTTSLDANAGYSYAELATPGLTGTSANNGMATYIRTDALRRPQSSCNGSHVNHEMWYLTSASAADWIEVGFHDGSSIGGSCIHDEEFWADNRAAGGGYHEHYYSYGWSLGSWYYMFINPGGSFACEWEVYLGGNVLGYSASNCLGSSVALQAGIETWPNTNNTAKGFLDEWEECGGNGCTRGFTGQTIAQNRPPFMRFQSFTNGTTGTEEVLNESW